MSNSESSFWHINPQHVLFYMFLNLFLIFHMEAVFLHFSVSTRYEKNAVHRVDGLVLASDYFS